MGPEHSAWGAPPPKDEAHRTRPSETLLPDEQPLAGPGEEPGTQRLSPHAARPSGRLIVATLLVALLGFVAAAALIHWIVRRPLYLHADMRSGKLQLLQQWRGRAYSASFGSSHVHNGFDPRSFDRTLAGTPLQTSSVNLAVAGGSQTEQRAMALEFLRQLQPPPRIAPEPCIVLLELTAGANFTRDHLVHPRAIDIYDLQTTRFVSHLTSDRMPLTQKWGRIGFAALASLLHYSNVGTLSNSVLPNLQPDSLYAMETAEDRRGVLSMSPSPQLQQMMRSIIAAAPPHPNIVQGEIYPGNYDLIRQLRSASAVPGVLFVYLVMPKLDDLRTEQVFPDSIQVDGKAVPIIDLGRPDRYPQLYRLGNWFDESHLDGTGAALATALTANALKAFYAAHPQPLACGG